MRRLFAKLVDVRQGEGGLVAGSVAVLFALIAAHTLLETTRDAVFLNVLSADKLPFVYVLLAFFSLFVARINNRFVSRFGSRNSLILTLFTAAYGTSVFYFLPESPAAAFALYVWSGLLGSILVVQFWVFTGKRFTVSQGKRLFGIIASGGVLGAVIGATSAVFLLDSIPVRALLIGATIVLLVAAVVLTATPVDDPKPLKSQAQMLGWTDLKKQVYLKRLILLIGISTATVLVADYMFKSVAEARVPAEELGTFFATYYSILNAVALVVQVFIAGYLVRRIGVIAAAGVLPILLLLGGTGTFFLAGAATLFASGGLLPAVLLTKGADGSLRHSLHRISSELLWLPVPEGLRDRTKALVDTVVVRVVQAAIAGLLLGLAAVDFDRPIILAALIIALAAGWLSFVIGLLRPYLDLFSQALSRRRFDNRLELDLDAMELVMESLSSDDDVRVLAAIDLLQRNQRDRLIPALILHHHSEEILVRALSIIATPDRRDWISLTRKHLENASPRVRIRALVALAGVMDREAVEGRRLDVNPVVRGHAAYWSAWLDGDAGGGSRENHPAVLEIVEMTGHPGIGGKVGLLEAAKGTGDAAFSDLIIRLSDSNNPRIVNAAAAAMATVRDPRFIPLLIERLSIREGRVAVRNAIVAMGAEALEALRITLNDPKTPRNIRRHLPRTISRFANQEAVDLLTTSLVTEKNGAVRYKILRGLGRLVSDHAVRVDKEIIYGLVADNLREHLRALAFQNAVGDPEDLPQDVQRSAALLVGLLRDKANQAHERAFRSLQIAHQGEDIHSVSLAVVSKDRATRAKAMEYLDALTVGAPVDVVRPLLRIVADDLPLPELVRRGSEFLDVVPTDRRSALQMLLEDEDPSVAGIAAFHAAHAEIDLRSTVEKTAERRQNVTELQNVAAMLRRWRGAHGLA